MNECYVRGSTIKYLRIPDEVIDMVKDENTARMKAAKVFSNVWISRLIYLVIDLDVNIVPLSAVGNLRREFMNWLPSRVERDWCRGRLVDIQVLFGQCVSVLLRLTTHWAQFDTLSVFERWKIVTSQACWTHNLALNVSYCWNWKPHQNFPRQLENFLINKVKGCLSKSSMII